MGLAQSVVRSVRSLRAAYMLTPKQRADGGCGHVDGGGVGLATCV